MKKFFVPRLALLGSAAALMLAACSSEGPVATSMAPRELSFALLTAPTRGVMTVCISAESPSLAGGYNIGTTGLSGVVTGDVIIGSGSVNLTPNNCTTVMTKGTEGKIYYSDNSFSWPSAFATLTASTAGGFGGSWTSSCVADTTQPVHCGQSTNLNPTVAGISNPHGSIVTFTFTSLGVGNPDPPTTGCTYTQGWYKNQGNSAVTNTNFFGTGVSWKTVLATKPKGNNYYNLADQYIPAKLAIGTATPPLAVATALTAAETCQ